jgi:hypothetical protein
MSETATRAKATAGLAAKVRQPDLATRFEDILGLLRTGTMVSGMARRLLESGFPVGVWNRTPGPTVHPVRVARTEP